MFQRMSYLGFEVHDELRTIHMVRMDQKWFSDEYEEASRTAIQMDHWPSLNDSQWEIAKRNFFKKLQKDMGHFSDIQKVR